MWGGGGGRILRKSSCGDMVGWEGESWEFISGQQTQTSQSLNLQMSPSLKKTKQRHNPSDDRAEQHELLLSGRLPAV